MHTVLSGLSRDAWGAVREGTSVYLFLLGMIALAELAGTQGVFEWIASQFVRRGRSGASVFWAVYGTGVVVTTFLSNDATILLLTPAALAVTRRSGVDALPAAYAAAFVANAASFVLPISNPANLLLYPRLPAPLPWMHTFLVPSLAAIAVTGCALFAMFRARIAARPQPFECESAPRFTAPLLVTIAVVSVSCIALVTAASLHLNVGLAATICAAVSIAVVSFFRRDALLRVVSEGQWSIIPLVAVLFVVIRLADWFGAVRAAASAIAYFNGLHWPLATLATGGAIALLANLINNLPAAVLSHYAASGNPSALIGIDLGPNAALSGSLATILWARILRKAGERVSAWSFLKVGLAVTVPALAAALLSVR